MPFGYVSKSSNGGEEQRMCVYFVSVKCVFVFNELLELFTKRELHKSSKFHRSLRSGTAPLTFSPSR